VVVFDDLPSDYSSSYRRNLPAEYILDPYFTLFENRAPSGIYRLQDISPDHFFKSEIYKTYYEPQGIKDETGVFCKLDEHRYLLVDMANRLQGKVGIGNIRRLQSIFSMLAALAIKHEELLAITGEAQKLIGAPLDRAFYNFGKDFLSARECEVIQLILKGHSSKSIARLLEISEDTVKVHRKRFHAKLEISSQAELFSLFLEAIALLPLGSDEDPLSYYFSGERTSAGPTR
jgi:DNA-binding CsgD family transcriptional regulator